MTNEITPLIPGFDLDALRLPQNFGESLGVKRLINRVPVRKPLKTEFFLVRRAMKLDELRDTANRHAQIDALPATGDLVLDDGLRVGYLNQFHQDHLIEADICISDFGGRGIRYRVRIPQLLEFALVNRCGAIPILERDELDIGIGQSENFKNIVLAQHRPDAGIAVVKFKQALWSPEYSHVNALCCFARLPLRALRVRVMVGYVLRPGPDNGYVGLLCCVYWVGRYAQGGVGAPPALPICPGGSPPFVPIT